MSSISSNPDGELGSGVAAAASLLRRQGRQECFAKREGGGVGHNPVSGESILMVLIAKFRHPDLGGSLFGTSNQRVDHFCAGLGMAKGLFR